MNNEWFYEVTAEGEELKYYWEHLKSSYFQQKLGCDYMSAALFALAVDFESMLQRLENRTEHKLLLLLLLPTIEKMLQCKCLSVLQNELHPKHTHTKNKKLFFMQRGINCYLPEVGYTEHVPQNNIQSC